MTENLELMTVVLFPVREARYPRASPLQFKRSSVVYKADVGAL
jgi:hypothetical protein